MSVPCTSPACVQSVKFAFCIVYAGMLIYVGVWLLLSAAIILSLALVTLCFLTFSLAGPAGW